MAAERPITDTTDTAATGLKVPHRPRVVLWDLDGTIGESGPVIVASIGDVLAKLGLPATDLDQSEVVGPPLRDNLLFAGVPEEIVDGSTDTYRGFYRSRVAEVPTYEGVEAALIALRDAGVVQAVATCKATDISNEQLTATRLADYFAVIAGSRKEDAWSTPKSGVITDALAKLREKGLLPEGDAGEEVGIVMVGDRHHDITGAAEHGIPTVSVRWGYGTPAEWDMAAASVETPVELVKLLGY